MKKPILGTAACVCLTVALATAAGAKTYRLTIAAGQPPRVIPSLKQVRDYFVPEVNRRIKAAGLKDRIKWKQAYAGTLLKPTKVLLGVQDGVADMGWVPIIFHPDKLPLDLVSFAAPFCTSDLSKVTKAADVLHQKVPAMKAQYDKFNLIRLAGSGIDSYHLLTKFEVTSVADLVGKKIATGGAALPWLRGTGAVPVQGNMMQFYNGVKTGVYDGMIIFGGSFPPMRYPQVAPNVTLMDFGPMYVNVLIINKDSMAKLPAALQKIIREAAVAWAAKSDAAHMAAGQWGVNTARKKFAKASFRKPGDAERKAWAMKMPNIAKDWAKRANEKGLPGTVVLSTYMQALRDQGVNCLRQWDKE